MRVEKILNLFSKPKQKNALSISSDARDGVQTLLYRMKKSTKYKQDGADNRWNSDILASISLGKKIKFSDYRIYIQSKKIPEKACDCSLHIGKNIININSATGQITGYETGIFMGLSKLISKAEKYIKTFVDNFDNPNVVTKNTFSIIIKDSKNKI